MNNPRPCRINQSVRNGRSGRGERSNSNDYFLAGRRLPWYAVGGSYIAANVSTEHFIGLIGASYIMGVAPALGQWTTTLAEVVIVFLFVPFLIRANVVTVPQYLAARFGPGVRLAFALLTIFANITIFMAAVLYAGGLALSGFFGWPLLVLAYNPLAAPYDPLTLVIVVPGGAIWLFSSIVGCAKLVAIADARWRAARIWELAAVLPDLIMDLLACIP